MELLHSDNVPVAIGPYSQAVKVNGLLYTSAQVPLKLNGEMVENDIKLQARQVFSNIKILLEDNESSMEEVIKLNIFLTNMQHFGIVNVIMAEVFGDHKPVRSTVEVAGLPKNAMIVMDVIATVADYH